VSTRTAWQDAGRVLAAALAALALAAAALLDSCGPKTVTPPELTGGTRIERYRALLAERESRSASMSASLTLWAEHGQDRMPGAQGDLLVAGPDRMRLRIASMFGTAVDLGLSGDSLRAYVPAWKTGLRLDSTADSLGFEALGGRMVSALCATWRPPDAAWKSAVWDDSLLRIAWLENGDSVAITVGSSGLPTQVELFQPQKFSTRARYRAWDRASGTAWPSHIELADPEHDVVMTCRATQMRFGGVDPQRLQVHWPHGIRPLTLAELRVALDRLGVL
jgi:hypothetical protein